MSAGSTHLQNPQQTTAGGQPHANVAVGRKGGSDVCVGAVPANLRSEVIGKMWDEQQKVGLP